MTTRNGVVKHQDLMSGADVAKALGIDRSAVSRLAAAGRLPVAARTLSRKSPLFAAAAIEAEAARRRVREMFSHS